MEIKLLKKPVLGYYGQDRKTILAYKDGEYDDKHQMSAFDGAVISAVNAAREYAHGVWNTATSLAETAWYYHSGQASRDAMNWLMEGVSAEINRTSQGGFEVHVKTPIGHVEGYANPPVTANSDSIKVGYSTNVGGGNIGADLTIKNPF